jgi:glycosyltransferase involved in cell wall biosynthesis
MRILVLTHNYPRFPADPAGAFVERLARGAAEAGHEVLVLAPHAPGLSQGGTEAGLTLQRFRYAPDSLERAAYTGDLHQRIFRSPATALAVPLFLAGFRREARRAVHSFRPDVVHAHWWMPGGWVAAGLGRPFVVTCHGSDVRLLERGGAMRRLGRRILGRASAITTVSRFLADDLMQRLGPDLPPVHPLMMPVDLSRFEAGRTVPKASPPRILYAGNLLRSKGIDVLLAASAKLEAQGIAHHLRILGEGSAEAELHATADRLGLRSVTWSHFVPQDQMPAEYGAATITVLPTRGRAEGLGLVLVEAVMAGSAIVGTPAGGIPEVISHEETGLLVPDGDAEQLAGALARLLADEPLRARLIATAQSRLAQRFAPGEAIRPFLALYDAVVAGRAH